MKIYNALTNRENYLKNLDMKIALNKESKHIEYQPYNRKIEQQKYYVNDNISSEGILSKFKENLSSVVNPLLIGPIVNNPLFDNNFINQQYINDRWYAFYNLLIQNFTTLNLSTFIDFCIYFLNLDKIKYKSTSSSSEIYPPTSHLISSSVNPITTTPTITSTSIPGITGTTTTTTVPPIPPILPGITGTTTTTVPPIPPILPGITGTTTTTVLPNTASDEDQIIDLVDILKQQYSKIIDFIRLFLNDETMLTDPRGLLDYYNEYFAVTVNKILSKPTDEIIKVINPSEIRELDEEVFEMITSSKLYDLYNERIARSPESNKNNTKKKLIDRIASIFGNKGKKQFFDILNKSKPGKPGKPGVISQQDVKDALADKEANKEANRLARLADIAAANKAAEADGSKKPGPEALQAQIALMAANKEARAKAAAAKTEAIRLAVEAEEAAKLAEELKSKSLTTALAASIAARKAAMAENKKKNVSDSSSDSDSDSDDGKGKKSLLKSRLYGSGLDKYTIKQIKEYLKIAGAGLHKSTIKQIKEYLKNRKKTGKGIKKLNTTQKKQIILGEIKAGNNNPLLLKMLKNKKNI